MPFKDDFLQLKRKFTLLDFDLISNLMESPSDIKKLVKRLTLIDYGHRIGWLYESLKGQMNVKVGDERYWPKLGSIACFHLNQIDKSDKESFMKLANEK